VQMEKLAIALLIASRKLWPYFQAHSIKVLTECPLKKVLLNLDLACKLANWAIKHEEFDIEYILQNATKGQALVDFSSRIHQSARITRIGKGRSVSDLRGRIIHKEEWWSRSGVDHTRQRRVV
jgi:hypothetical protein